MTTNDGGPAFPAEGGPDSGIHPNPGMTLRDWFAGQYLAGRAARGALDDAADTAAFAYRVADAMLAVRGKPSP